MKLAVLTSHPIQYQTPLFRKLARRGDIDLSVYFCWTAGLTSNQQSYLDAQFGKEVKWDIPLLGGFDHVFLKNFSVHPSSDFWGQVNPMIISAIFKNRYDAILIYGWNSFTNWLAFAAAFLARTPVFLHGENPLNQEMMKSKSRRFLKRIIFRLLFSLTRAFLYIGKENKKFYTYYGVPDHKLFFAPYAVDNERFMHEAEKREKRTSAIKQKFGIDPASSVILFVGKLIDKKRPLDLLKAHEIITKSSTLSPKADPPRAESAQSFLLFVGDGELRSSLEAYTLRNTIPNVYFAGFQNQTELPDFYAIADVLVLPSGVGETWGLVMNEAMCFKTAIICSDMVGGGPDLVRHGINGFLFPVGDVNALAHFLGELLRDSRRVRLFGKQSLEIVGTYSHERDGEEIERTLGSLRHENVN